MKDWGKSGKGERAEALAAIVHTLGHEAHLDLGVFGAGVQITLVPKPPSTERSSV